MPVVGGLIALPDTQEQAVKKMLDGLRRSLDVRRGLIFKEEL